ncbi:hypothetical protein [Arenivirga flava]|uniref:Uncharacterized protein n=1 Tax=Arenivirga flava TaxID=1930060 RepID=A0AA37UF64_9MICO|nr:hypothetical protein [Arenivirga flava]GMA29328.1 hypothetical protein GCM10025874_25810 [Arenivirga flava]
MSDPGQQRESAPDLLTGLDQNLQQPFGGRDAGPRPGSIRRALVALATGLLVLAAAVTALLLR